MPKELHELSASEVLRQRFELEAALSSSPSLSGVQLESAKANCHGPGHNGAQVNYVEEKRIRLMDLMHLTKDLSRQELDAVRLRYWTLATVKKYEATRRFEDLIEGDGEEIIDPRPSDSEGKPMTGFVRVEGKKQQAGSFEAVAERMAADGATDSDGNPMGAGAARRRVGDALAKVGFAIKGLAFRVSLEEGAM